MENQSTKGSAFFEEIESLEIPDDVKIRIFGIVQDEVAKADEEILRMNFKLEAKQYDLDQMREQNIALKNACFDLAAALKQQYEL